jgi:hypothetical protein
MNTSSLVPTWWLWIEHMKSRQSSRATLLDLLSFLNPDSILLDFVESGMMAVDSDPQELLSDPINLAEALMTFAY